MTKHRLDSIDRSIIAILQANGREPIATLAAKIGLSRSAAQERLQRLQRDGVIEGFTVRLREPPSAALRAYLVLTLAGPICERVAPALAGLPEVKRCDSLAGEVDLLLEVSVESAEDLGRLRDRIAAVHGVRSVKTMTVLRSHFMR